MKSYEGLKSLGLQPEGWAESKAVAPPARPEPAAAGRAAVPGEVVPVPAATAMAAQGLIIS